MAPEAGDSHGHKEDRAAEADSPLVPDWVTYGDPDWGERLEVPEWRDDGGEYRRTNGWRGRDLVHDVVSPVRVLEYYARYGPGIDRAIAADARGASAPSSSSPPPSLSYKAFARGGVGTLLTGIVHFTRNAEGHKGFCRGMLSIMDDAIGWASFLATGKCLPWSGNTVHVDTRLRCRVPVNSFLLVQAEITRMERRKVSVKAILKDPPLRTAGEGAGRSNADPGTNAAPSSGRVYAGASGLVILDRAVLCDPAP